MENNSNVKRNKKNKQKKKAQGRSVIQRNPMVDGGIIDLQPYQSNKVVFFKDIVPPRIFTRLKFICNRKLNNAGLAVASIQFNANGIFDFDPAVASNQVAGFDELAYIWGRYRVYGVSANCRFVTLDALAGIIVNLGFESEFYTANTKNLTNFDGPNQKTRIVGTANSVPQVLSMKRNALAVVGDNIVYTEFSYTGTSASNPSSLWYVSVAADVSNVSGAFTNGVAIRAEFEIEVEWFERLDVDSSLTHEIRKNICEKQIRKIREREASVLLSKK